MLLVMPPSGFQASLVASSITPGLVQVRPCEVGHEAIRPSSLSRTSCTWFRFLLQLGIPSYNPCTRNGVRY